MYVYIPPLCVSWIPPLCVSWIPPFLFTWKVNISMTLIACNLSTIPIWLFLTSWWRTRQWQPTTELLPGKSHGQRSLVGCSPWGCEESDMTEQLHFHFSLSCIGEGNGNPLQCSCLENLRDGGAWWAAIYRVTQSLTQLKWLSSSNILVMPLSSHTFSIWSSYLPPNRAISMPWCWLYETCMVNYFSWQISEMDTIFLVLKVSRWTHKDSSDMYKLTESEKSRNVMNQNFQPLAVCCLIAIPMERIWFY